MAEEERAAMHQLVNILTLFYLWNYGHLPTLKVEVEKMLELASSEMVEKGVLLVEEVSRGIPAINIRRAVPRLPGMDHSTYSNYTGEM